MKAIAVPLITIFDSKQRLEVPLFQRQYVWGRNDQWQPLWEDIERKFIEYLEGRKDAPLHFLGAMVLDQKQTPTTHVIRRQVIDGQQRLMTMQIFLAAFRDYCRELSFDDLASEFDTYTLNRGMLTDPRVDKFKIWPTQSDRSQFEDVITAMSRDKLENMHPRTRRKYARSDDPRPRMVEAYFYFYDRLQEFFSNIVPELASEAAARKQDVLECFQALHALQAVVIDLDKEDDAQVIFETLNSRGAPLSSADLLRNFIFLRAARAGEPQEQLYEEFWKSFEDQFWLTKVRFGALYRPRTDLYIQHFLASRLSREIQIRHLFVEYKSWIERDRPFSSVREEVTVLARQREDFRRLIKPRKDDAMLGLSTFLDAFEIGTAYPLLLHLLDIQTSRPELIEISTILESYLVRRSICGYTTKSYGRIFPNLIRSLRESGSNPTNLRETLANFSHDSTVWPKDDEFYEEWMNSSIYNRLQSKLSFVLKRLNETYLNKKSEDITINSPLTVEHIMPQNWVEHWLLPDGSRGLPPMDLWNLGDSPRSGASKLRNKLVGTIGNLTILTQNLNSAISNNSWPKKKKGLLEASLLPINQQLQEIESWNEKEIEARGKELFARAIKLWPGP